MHFPTTPCAEDICAFMNWQCIHILSNRKYHDYVSDEAIQPEKVRNATPCMLVRFLACSSDSLPVMSAMLSLLVLFIPGVGTGNAKVCGGGRSICGFFLRLYFATVAPQIRRIVGTLQNYAQRSADHKRLHVVDIERLHCDWNHAAAVL